MLLFVPSVTKTFILRGIKLSIVQHLTEADKAVLKELYMQMFHTLFPTPEMLRSVRQRIDERWDVCRISS
jgi:hypothetical protein